jgi:DNA sulfur modification protein DndD
MKIKSIEIENFRSYYRTNLYDIGEGLTLIVGDNGDGKTTFFEALEWLLDTTKKLGMNKRYISQKRLSELIEGESAVVKVSMRFEHDGEKVLEKSFTFSKDFSGEISTSSYIFKLFIKDGSESIEKAGEYLDYYFAPSVRNYCLFKGESTLDIFNSKDALNYLVETFSEIANFDPYVNFTEYCKSNASRALDNALSADKKNSREAARLNALIDSCNREISNLEAQLKQKRKEAVDFSQLLSDIEKSKEASTLLQNINSHIRNLAEEKATCMSRIKENYTIRLLDERWVLCGFEEIAKEYSAKISKFRRLKSKLENEYQQEIGANKKIAEIQTQLADGKVPLPLYIPTEAVMREMLDDHVCKVCGTPAPEGSDAYNFMRNRLNQFLESLKSKEEDTEEKCLFPHSFIQELEKRDTLISNEMNFLANLQNLILEDLAFNQMMKDKVNQLEAAIAQEEENKRKLIAQADGLDEEALLNAYENITNWWQLKNAAEKSIIQLENLLEDQKNKLREYETSLDKLAKGSSAAIYGRSSKAIRLINEAFNSAKIRNKEEFIHQLEDVANKYLDKLNVDGFTGYIKILSYPDGSVKTELIDNKNIRIYNPNTALQTTMYMSVLFAIAELTSLKRENDYPLIFDAPTSSFAGNKENDFFRIIGTLKKQIIIFTKSYLIPCENGENRLDKERIKEVKGLIYRIQKKKPYDNKDLSTIQIVKTLID